MEEQTTVDKDYLEVFNQGYEVAKELGLKPDGVNDLFFIPKLRFYIKKTLIVVSV
ncbi:hypothetical protein [Flavivirga spongiicola]|uniref:Uncharacterized protein n=1 Tax=Flavivirga spongiicola TaxID=421621 RepID=A0ABU7XQU9_9FLAO|nr:hypothetical protein [Flavivirga sp. MEBiC05379]MDO5981861.1 hypothetical protein [Flavivirga sp. MEBiC05379]